LHLTARVEREAGHPTLAAEAAANTIRFGSLIAQRPSTELELAIALDVMRNGLDEARRVLQSAPSEPRVCDILEQALVSSDVGITGFVYALRGEFVLLADQVRSFMTTEPIHSDRSSLVWMVRTFPSFARKPETTLRMLADHFRIVRANVSLPQGERSIPNPEVIYHVDWPKGAFRPNFYGELCMSLVDPGVMALSRFDMTRAERAGTLLLIALRRSQSVRRRLPDTLSELVPAFLAAIPADPMDGQPFRYRPDLGAVYSIGHDLQDNGGDGIPGGASGSSGLADVWSAPDAVFYLHPQPPPEPDPE
jgi:hypothetical protein